MHLEHKRLRSEDLEDSLNLLGSLGLVLLHELVYPVLFLNDVDVEVDEDVEEFLVRVGTYLEEQ